MKSATFILFASTVSLLAGPGDAFCQWERFDGPEASQINDIESHGAYLYASTEEGVYRSADDGRTWVAVNSGLPMDTYFADLAFIGTELFVLTHDRDKSRLLRSMDAGETWVDVSTGLPDELNSLVVLGARLFVVGTDSSNYDVDIYRSTSRGEDWQSVGTEEVRLSEFLALTAQDYVLFAVTAQSVYRSTDYGEGWSLVNAGLGADESWIELKSGVPDEVYIQSLVATDDSLFASAQVSEVVHERPLDGGDYSCYGCAEFEALFRSTDGGNSWTLLNWEPEAEHAGNTNFFDIVSGEQALFASSWRGVFRSTDNGDYWRLVNEGLPAEEGQLLPLATSLVQVGDTLFVGSWDGVYTSADSGQNWKAANAGLPVNTYADWLAVSDGTVYASLGSHGVYTSRDFGKSWESIGMGSKVTEVGTITSTSNDLIVSTGQGLYRSADNGDSWTAVKPVHPHSWGSLVVNGSCLYIVTYREIYGSVDGGNTWRNIRPTTESGIGNLAVSGKTLIYSGYEQGLFRSTDNGESWIDLDDQKLKLFYGFSELTKAGDRLFGSYGAGAFMSTDNGDSWTMINGGLPADFRRGLTTLGNRLYGHSQKGIFMFNEQKANWEPIARPLPESELQRLDASRDDLYAYTRGAGIWRLRMSQLSGAID